MYNGDKGTSVKLYQNMEFSGKKKKSDKSNFKLDMHGYHAHVLLLVLNQISPILTTDTTRGKYNVCKNIVFSQRVGAMLRKLL